MRSETLETIKQKNGLIDQIKEVDFWMLTMTIALAMYGLGGGDVLALAGHQDLGTGRAVEDGGFQLLGPLRRVLDAQAEVGAVGGKPV